MLDCGAELRGKRAAGRSECAVLLAGDYGRTNSMAMLLRRDDSLHSDPHDANHNIHTLSQRDL
jgi:hypothetical protein